MGEDVKPTATPGSVSIDYTNWRGERSVREIVPITWKLGANEWHPEKQWMVLAHDVAKNADRWFALSGIHSWGVNSHAELEAKAKLYPELVEALREATGIIKQQLPIDALGMVTANGGTWPLLEEYLRNFDAILAKVQP